MKKSNLKALGSQPSFLLFFFNARNTFNLYHLVNLGNKYLTTPKLESIMHGELGYLIPFSQGRREHKTSGDLDLEKVHSRYVILKFLQGSLCEI